MDADRRKTQSDLNLSDPIFVFCKTYGMYYIFIN
jgi:hypothetical protein